MIPLITTVPQRADTESALTFITAQHQRLANGQAYPFAIAEMTSDRALGQIGLWPLERGRATVGYWVRGQDRRRGVARHALAMISRWGLSLSSIHRIELYTEPTNEPSCRTARAAGYQRERVLSRWHRVAGQLRDMVLYSLSTGQNIDDRPRPREASWLRTRALTCTPDTR